MIRIIIALFFSVILSCITNTEELFAQELVFQYGRSLSSNTLLEINGGGFLNESRDAKSFEYYSVGYRHRIGDNWNTSIHLERSNFLATIELADTRTPSDRLIILTLTPYSASLRTLAIVIQADRILNAGDKFEVSTYVNVSLGRIRRLSNILDSSEREAQFWNALQFVQRTTHVRGRVGANIHHRGFVLSVDTEPFRSANLFKPFLFDGEPIRANYNVQFVRIGLSCALSM